jgi:peptidoglycan hydrolase-like protein with peptidoglycan-binding domain
MRTFDDLLVDAGVALDERSAELVTAEVLLAPSGAHDGGRSRWIALTGAAAALAVTAGSTWWVTHQRPASSTTATSLTSAVPTTTDAVPPASAPPISATLAVGSVGDDVQRVEELLLSLGFFVGDVDGEFDAHTEQAVWAWKKLVGGITWQTLRDSPTKSDVTPEIWQQMLTTVIEPRRPTGDETTHVEVYLPLQVLVVFRADDPLLIAHISSGEVDDAGNPSQFCDRIVVDTDEVGNTLDAPQEMSVCATSKTPGGVFMIQRRHEGRRGGPLGGMYWPQYFNYGIAIHGAVNVPAAPVSHGGVRVSEAAADELWEALSEGDAVLVWGHDGREPEEYTQEESLPSFSYPEPTATTP